MASSSTGASEILRALRQQVSALERHRPHSACASDVAASAAAARPGTPVLALGIADLDRRLGGGLALGALHEIMPAAPIHLGAAAGVAMELAAVAGRRGGAGQAALWIQSDLAGLEAGRLYGFGVDLLGLPVARLIELRVPHERDALWAMEEALHCRGLAAVVGEFASDRSLDLTVLRRLSLAAAVGGGLGLVLRHHADRLPTPAVTSLEIAAAPGLRDAFGGLGRPAVRLALVRNRRGPIGQWFLSWDHHEHAFLVAPSARTLAVPARDRPHRADADVRAG